MTRSPPRIVAFAALAAALATALAACSSVAPAPSASAQNALMPSVLDRIEATLVAGLDAEGLDPPALARAASMLASSGARAAEGSENLAESWRQEAAQRGSVLEEIPLRGRISGPAYRAGTLGAAGAFETEQNFLAGQRAEIRLVSPGNGGRVELLVSDAKGKEPCDVAHTQSGTSCRWVPLFTERYKIKVVNRAESGKRFVLLLN